MITTYFLNCISEDIFKHQETSTIPYDFYLALSSTEPNIAGENVTEPVSDTGYARVQIDNSNEVFNEEVDGDGNITNHRKLYFPESIKPWENITHYAIFDEPIDGNLLMYGALNETVNVPIKTILSIPIGELKISASN